MHDRDSNEYRVTRVEEKLEALWAAYEKTGDPQPLVEMLDRVLTRVTSTGPKLSEYVLMRIRSAAALPQHFRAARSPREARRERTRRQRIQLGYQVIFTAFGAFKDGRRSSLEDAAAEVEARFEPPTARRSTLRNAVDHPEPEVLDQMAWMFGGLTGQDPPGPADLPRAFADLMRRGKRPAPHRSSS